jgi:N-methylhydantoinase A
MYVVGIDIGGTFTDLLAINVANHKHTAKKVLTTPHDPSVGVMQIFNDMLEELNISADIVENVIHATTLVTNTLIERKGAKTALITSKGFRDILEIGREWRYDLYDLFIEMPEPLVPRNLRYEVPERILYDGSIHESLDLVQAAELIDRINSEEIEAIAVSFLHSYRNNSHEQRVEELITEKLPGVPVSLSSECIPEIREYERTSTTVVNAYTQPITKNYLSRLQKMLNAQGYKKKSYFIMLSSGGIAMREIAEKFPSRIVESGPAAGAIFSTFIGQLKKTKSLLSFDMGGTTAKICMIEDGTPRITTDFEIARVYRFKKGSGLPLNLPVIDMIEIGTGGGSKAAIDELGLMKVGPHSAGSEPGPICYDRGGEDPTVTDSDLLLGYLNPEFFLGGQMKLNLAKTKRIVKEKIADPLQVDLTKAAYGIRQVADEDMANAARVYAAEKGLDYKNFTMIAFGGQGPNHGQSICRLLGIKELIIPFRAGVASAFGMLVSPISFDMVRSYVCRFDNIDLAYLNSIFSSMELEGRELLKSAGVEEDDIRITRMFDGRYVGQGHEITVNLPLGEFSAKHLSDARAAFEAEYKRIFYRVNKDSKIEGLSWRVVATGPKPISDFAKLSMLENMAPEQVIKGKRKAYSPQIEGFEMYTVYDRYGLSPGMEIQGPAIIEEMESTSVIGYSDTAYVDEYNNLIVKIRD